MAYEINVAKNGTHVFATHPRSLNSLLENQAVELLKDFRKRFPRSEGWDCTLSRQVSYGETLHVSEEHDLEDVPNMEGLSQCKVCKGTEGALPTECPGVELTLSQMDAVMAGKWNYHHGKWHKS
jgi:hypothetical protein